MIIIDHRPFEMCSFAYIVKDKKIIDTQQIASQPQGMLDGLKVLINKYDIQEIYVPRLNTILLEELQKEYPNIMIIGEDEE